MRPSLRRRAARRGQTKAGRGGSGAEGPDEGHPHGTARQCAVQEGAVELAKHLTLAFVALRQGGGDSIHVRQAGCSNLFVQISCTFEM